MKKTTLKSLAWLMMCLCALTFAACSSDDGDDSSIKPKENNDNKVELMGSWTLITCDENGAPIGATYTFSDNGTGTISEEGKSTTFTYTYKANGEFTITPSGSDHFMKGLITVYGDSASGTYRWDDGSTDHHFTFKKKSDNDSDNDDKDEEKHAFKLNDGDPIPESLKANPVAYGYEAIEVTVDQYSYDYSSTTRLTPLLAYQDSEGFFILGDIQEIGCIYHKWMTKDKPNLPYEYTFDGIYSLNIGDKYYQEIDRDAQQWILILPTKHVVQKVEWFDTEVRTVNSDASSYSSNRSLGIVFNVYDNVDEYSQVQVSCSDSWLTSSTIVVYRKGDTTYDGVNTYRETRIAILFATTQNTGSDRTGYIYITVTGIDGKTYTQTYTIKQSGSSSNSGTSNDLVTGKVTATIKAIGPGVSYDSYASYVNGKTTQVDYAYNPSTGKYYVYGGIYDHNSDANGGKGVRYDAQKGYNSITIDSGYYYDYVMKISYRWEILLQVTLP